MLPPAIACWFKRLATLETAIISLLVERYRCRYVALLFSLRFALCL